MKKEWKINMCRLLCYLAWLLIFPEMMTELEIWKQEEVAVAEVTTKENEIENTIESPEIIYKSKLLELWQEQKNLKTDE